MANLSLDEAVSQIAQAALEESGVDRPFVFIVGAGIAAPTVPLASQIVSHCQSVAGKYKRRTPPASAAAIDGYSHWFEHAYPSAKQRQRYLRSLIEDKPIPSSSLRLAHLLLDGRVANAVVTPNFDDFVSRALTLFGEPHVVCDHPGTVERIDAETRDVQVVHVHGSYWFYDCCNLKGEIQARATDQHASLSMSSLLDSLFARRSAIVLGYAGWEGDVIMGALQRRLKRVMPFNLYWFCYRAKDKDDLPEWLRSHPQVHFVLPETTSGELGDAPASSPATKSDDTMSAHRAIARLIEAMDLQAPPLTSDPLAFFARALRTSLAGLADDGDDIYGIREVIARVEQAASLPGKPTKETESIPQLLERLQDALRRSQPREALRLCTGLEIGGLDTPALRALQKSLWHASTELLDDSAEELQGYAMIVDVQKVLDERGHADQESVMLFSKAAVFRGLTLDAMGRSLEAVDSYDAVVARVGESPDEELQAQVGQALTNRGVSLGKLSRSEEALKSYDEVVGRFGRSKHPGLRERVARALVLKGVCLFDMSRAEEALATYAEVDERFRDAEMLAVREQVAKALVNRGYTLGHLSRAAEELEVYDDVLRRFGASTEPALRTQAAMALVNKGFRLGKEAGSVEALATYQDVVKRFADAPEVATRRQVAKAIFNSGVRLGSLSRHEEEIQAYDEVLRRYWGAAEPELSDQVASALLNKGITLKQTSRPGEAKQAFEQLIRRFENHLPAARQVSKARVHLAELPVVDVR